jgi:1-acyl-sn-glycerol-3-phosphate acyltransferase
MRQLSKIWRALGTGFCFVVFALLSLLASLTVLPVLLLWPMKATRRERRIRAFVSGSFRALLGLVAALGLGRVEVEGREWLKHAEGKLIVAPHPMYLDVVALLALLPQADCVVKSALLSNPFYRRFARAAGYIGNDDCAALLAACANSLRRRRSLILFPEGTRSTPGEPLKFRRGAAQVAVRSGCDLLPIVIDCNPPALLKGGRWYQVPKRAWRLRITVCAPKPLSEFGYRPDMPVGVAARHLTSNLEQLFNQHLQRHDDTHRRIEATHHRLARS